MSCLSETGIPKDHHRYIGDPLDDFWSNEWLNHVHLQFPSYMSQQEIGNIFRNNDYIHKSSMTDCVDQVGEIPVQDTTWLSADMRHLAKCRS